MLCIMFFIQNGTLSGPTIMTMNQKCRSTLVYVSSLGLRGSEWQKTMSHAHGLAAEGQKITQVIK